MFVLLFIYLVTGIFFGAFDFALIAFAGWRQLPMAFQRGADDGQR